MVLVLIRIVLVVMWHLIITSHGVAVKWHAWSRGIFRCKKSTRLVTISRRNNSCFARIVKQRLSRYGSSNLAHLLLLRASFE